MLGHGHDLERKLSESEAQAQPSIPPQSISMFETSGLSSALFDGSWYLEFLYYSISLGWQFK